jgi:hypothetical protein
MKSIKRLAFAGLLAVFVLSCSDDNNESGTLKLSIKTIKDNPAFNKAVSQNGLTIEKFLVNISEVEFDIDNEDHPGLPDYAESHEIKGNYVVDLMSRQSIDGFDLGTTHLPFAKYDDIEFEFDVCNDPKQTELFGNSLYVSGKVNDKSFVISTNEDWEIEIDFEDNRGFVFNGESKNLIVEFKLYEIVNILNRFDIQSAKDNNENGIIEINPSNEDGNARLCKQIVDALEDAFDLD